MSEEAAVSTCPSHSKTLSSLFSPLFSITTNVYHDQMGISSPLYRSSEDRSRENRSSEHGKHAMHPPRTCICSVALSNAPVPIITLIERVQNAPSCQSKVSTSRLRQTRAPLRRFAPPILSFFVKVRYLRSVSARGCGSIDVAWEGRQLGGDGCRVFDWVRPLAVVGRAPIGTGRSRQNREVALLRWAPVGSGRERKTRVSLLPPWGQHTLIQDFWSGNMI